APPAARGPRAAAAGPGAPRSSAWCWPAPPRPPASSGCGPPPSGNRSYRPPMVSDDRPPPDPLGDWLLAYDEALADAARPRPPAEPPLPPDRLPEARRAAAYLR